MNTVWVVLENADLTEGRGPMLLRTIFSNFDAAHKWVMSRRGIGGGPQKQISKGDLSSWYYDGYSIQKKVVLENEEDVLATKRRQQEIKDQIQELKDELASLSNV